MVQTTSLLKTANILDRTFKKKFMMVSKHWQFLTRPTFRENVYSEVRGELKADFALKAFALCHDQSCGWDTQEVKGPEVPYGSLVEGLSPYSGTMNGTFLGKGLITSQATEQKNSFYWAKLWEKKKEME